VKRKNLTSADTQLNSILIHYFKSIVKSIILTTKHL